MNALKLAGCTLAFVSAAIVGAAAVAPQPAVSQQETPAYQIGGRLLAADSDLPLSGTVIATQVGLNGDASVLPARVGDDGDFVFRDLQPGPVTLIGMAEGRGRVARVVVVQERAPIEVFITLPRAVEVTGRVVDELGRGISGAEISVEYSRKFGTERLSREDNRPTALYSGSWEVFHQDPSGAFRLHNIDPGRNFEIVVTVPDGGTQRYPILQREPGDRLSDLDLIVRD